jgi:hypothetical protein
MGGRVESYWEVLEPRFEEVNIYEGPEKFAESVAALPRPILLLYATHMCASEIHNGGFLQLFWNNTCVCVPEAIEGYTSMGMTNLGGILGKAASTLGEPYPRDRDDRWDSLLGASGRSPEELEAIFESTENLYLCFVEATKPLDFDALDRAFWRIAGEEEGGFDVAATRYVNSMSEDSNV